jgi:acetyltransferase-like isoleucine patch superfamily enzyme
MIMVKLFQFINKHPFPMHFVILWDWQIMHRFSTWICSVWVRMQLRLLGCRFGKNLKADGMPVIRMAHRGAITFGDNCQLNSRFMANLVGKATPTILDCRGGGNIHFGNNSGCSFAVISSRIGIEIGDHVKIGGNVRIFDHDYHSLNYLDRRDGNKDQPNCRKRPVKIGNDVFIGTNAMILKGVTIGDRAIVGAGSVVSCNVPADEIWAGNPAQFVRRLEHKHG